MFSLSFWIKHQYFPAGNVNDSISDFALCTNLKQQELLPHSFIIAVIKSILSHIPLPDSTNSTIYKQLSEYCIMSLCLWTSSSWVSLN